MSDRLAGSCLRRLLVLAGLTFALASGAAAEDSPDFERRRWMVLGPNGRPVERVRLTRLPDREARGRIFDESATHADVRTPGGILHVPGPDDSPPDPVAVWGPGLAALELPHGRRAVGVRLAKAEPLSGTLRFERGEPAGRLPVLAWHAADIGLVHRVRTDEAGRFRFAHLRAGPWEVAVVRGDGRHQSLGRFMAGRGRVAARLSAGSAVRGRLLDDAASRQTGVEGLRLRIGRLPMGMPGAPIPVSVETDADGRFTIPDVPAGIYEATLDASGWFFATGNPRFEVPRRGGLRLPPCFVVRGLRVTGRVEGGRRVPVAGARVRLVPDPLSPTPPGGWPEIAAGRTDESGTFAFEPVRPGARYWLAVRAAGFAPGRSEVFEVAPGKGTRVPVVRLTEGWTLEVRARAPGGAPLPDVRVVAWALDRPASDDGEGTGALARADEEWTFEGVTGADGRVEIADLPNDDVRARAYAEGRTDATGRIPRPQAGDARVWNATLFAAPGLRGQVVASAEGSLDGLVVRVVPQERGAVRMQALAGDGLFDFTNLLAVPTDVEVARGDGPSLARVEGVVPGSTVEHLRIQLPPLSSVSGRVVGLAAGAGEVEVLLEAPLFDPRVGEHRWRAVSVVTPVLQAEGSVSFSFGALPPGAYAVRARQRRNDTGPWVVHLEEEKVEGIELVMPTPGRIAGSVLDGESLPVLGAKVVLERLRGEGDAPRLPGGPLRDATDLRGAFVFANVAPGLWRLRVDEAGAAPDQEIVRVDEGESLVVRDLVLSPGGVLIGTVTDARGRLLGDALLILEPLEDGLDDRRLRTGGDGRFRAEGLRAGLWRLRLAAHAGSLRDLEMLVEIVADETTEVRIETEGSARIEGQVQRQGRAVADAMLYLLRLDVEEGVLAQRFVARSDAEGKFAWDGLEAGLYHVDLVDGGVYARRPVALRANDVLTLDLEAYDGRIPGVVRLPSGVAVAGVTVRATPQDSSVKGLAARAQTDPEGRFLIAGLPRGTYDLRVGAAGLPPGRLFGAIAEELGAERPVSIVLGQGGTLDLRASGPAGRGVGATRLWIEEKDGTPLNPQAYVTPPTGRIVVNGVPEGTWWLRVHSVGFGRPARVAVKIREGEETALTVALEPAGRLQALVSGAGRDPVTRARIDLLRLPDEEPIERRRKLRRVRLQPPWGFVPRTGVAEFEDLSAGRVLLRIDAGPYYEVARIEATIVAGETTELEIGMRRAE